MLPLRYARRWQAAGILVLLAVLVAALSPVVPDLDDPRFPSDKWLHGLTFAFLTVWFSGQYAARAYWRVAIGVLAFGGLIELCQEMLVYRSAELADLVADSIGVAAGLLMARAGAGGWSLRVEAWLQVRPSS